MVSSLVWVCLYILKTDRWFCGWFFSIWFWEEERNDKWTEVNFNINQPKRKTKRRSYASGFWSCVLLVGCIILKCVCVCVSHIYGNCAKAQKVGTLFKCI